MSFSERDFFTEFWIDKEKTKPDFKLTDYLNIVEFADSEDDGINDDVIILKAMLENNVMFNDALVPLSEYEEVVKKIINSKESNTYEDS